MCKLQCGFPVDLTAFGRDTSSNARACAHTYTQIKSGLQITHSRNYLEHHKKWSSHSSSKSINTEWKHVSFETFTIVFLLNSNSMIMDVPEKYQSTDTLECPLAKGYLIEWELMDKVHWNRIWFD